MARHCETDWNKEGRIQGTTDIPLNATGRAQAADLAHRLRGEPGIEITKIITSPLLRAAQTAEIIAEHFELSPDSIIREPRFSETSFGILEGLTDIEIIQHHCSDYKKIPYDFRSFGGERYVDVVQRQTEAMHTHLFFDRPTQEKISTLVIGHGRSLRSLIAHHQLAIKLAQGQFHLVEIA